MTSSNLIFFNLNGLSEVKLAEIELEVSSVSSSSSVLFVGLCETKEPALNDPSSSYCRDIRNFQTYRKPFCANSCGLLAFVHQSVAVRPRPDLESSPHVLILECRFPGSPSSCLVATCYRAASEGKTGWDALERSLSSAVASKLPLILIGDFNARSQHFGDPVNEYYGGLLSKFCDANSLFVLNPMLCPDRPTRKQSVLDLAIVSDFGMVSDMSVAGKHGFVSDHRSIELDLSFAKIAPQQPKTPRTRWNIDKADWPLFAQALSSKAPQALSDCQVSAASASSAQANVDSMVETMSAMFNSAGEFAVGRCETKESDVPWWKSHPDLQPVLAAYRRAKKQYDRKRTADRQAELKSAWIAWRDAVAVARNKRWERECQRISSGGNVNWKAFKEVHKPATFPINCIRNRNGQLPSSTQEALNSLAEHFADVCTLPELKKPTDEQASCKREAAETIAAAERSQSPALDKPFELAELKDAIKLFKNPKSAAGPDQIPTMFLKRSSDEALEVLLFIFNYSWKHSVVPKQWRQANVCALFKSGSADRSNALNYRPISLTSVVCKLLERVILKRLLVAVGHRIHVLQFGFSTGRSTIDALLRLQHKVFAALKNRHHLSAAFLDISKAFDRTWHEGLLHKLAKIGVAGNAWRWCQAFLSQREIRTVHDAQCSDWFGINAGVPQGSVLSPFFFLVYINDAFEVCGDRAELSLFADDIVVVPTKLGPEGDGLLFKSLTMLDSWSKQWRLDFNAKKSKVLKFSVKLKKKVQRSGFISDFFLGSEVLERVKFYDYLGLRWQENGQWREHLQKVAASAKRVSNLICSVVSRDAPPLPVIRLLVHALVRTKFCYGMPVWKANTEVAWRQLDSIVVEPMRRRLALPYNTFVTSILVETNTLSMRFQYEMSLVNLAIRVAALPPAHVTRELQDEQEAQIVTVQKRTPVFVAALQVISRRELDVKRIDKRLSLVKFTIWQRLAWRQSGRGKLLRQLTNGGYDPNRLKFCLPQYLHVDRPRIAAIRAKLRFDRSNLKDTLRRQNIIKRDVEAQCIRCRPAHPPEWHELFACPARRLSNRVVRFRLRPRETLKHLLLACPAHSRAREALKAKAKQLGLPTTNSDMFNWLLGDLEAVDPALRVKALSLGAQFLSVVDSARPL
jgi:hypothetical protein